MILFVPFGRVLLFSTANEPNLLQFFKKKKNYLNDPREYWNLLWRKFHQKKECQAQEFIHCNSAIIKCHFVL